MEAGETVIVPAQIQLGSKHMKHKMKFRLFIKQLLQVTKAALANVSFSNDLNPKIPLTKARNY
jgi:hypothetical protein